MPQPPPQSYAKHRMYVPGFHFVLIGIVLVALAGAIFHLVRALSWGFLRTQAATLLLTVIACGLLAWYSRAFAMKVQDRAIRAEEALRCYLLTGKPLDPRLRMRQILALRFASDEEYPELMRRAAEEGMRGEQIKQAIRSWRADHHRA